MVVGSSPTVGGGNFLCIKFRKVREELIDKLNKLDANTKITTLLEIIEYYYYYSKKLSKSKMRKRMIIMELD